MLVEGMIGDAYGAGFEFAERTVIDQYNDVTQYIVHPRFKSIYKTYTDDTQMAIAIAELLIEGKEWNKERIANKFVEVFKRDPREGYASRFYNLLQQVGSGEELLRTIKPNSKRNGAVMRVFPIGILSSETEILRVAKMQAEITHNTVEAITSSQAVALAAHYFIYNKGKKAGLISYLNNIQGIKWYNNWNGEIEIDAEQTVQAVFTLVTSGEASMQILLKKSVSYGGDVDTVASLVLALASLSDEFENDLPEWLLDEVENKAYGKDYIQSLDQELFKLRI